MLLLNIVAATRSTRPCEAGDHSNDMKPGPTRSRSCCRLDDKRRYDYVTISSTMGTSTRTVTSNATIKSANAVAFR